MDLIIPMLLLIFFTSTSISCDRLRLTDDDRELNLMDRFDTNRIDTTRIDTNQIDSTGRP